MTDKQTGGSAFPGPDYIPGYGNQQPVFFPDGRMEWQSLSSGMTLRDYFAAKAMAGLIQRYDHSDDFWWVDLSVEDDAGVICRELENDAMRCYRVADAMLKARDE